MNEMDGKNRDTKAASRPSSKAAEVGLLCLLITMSALYHRFAEHLTIREVVEITGAVIVLWVLGASSAAWFFSRPRDLLNDMRHMIDQYEAQGTRLGFELRATLREALEKQPYVDDDMLSIIESNASNIWVITTDLRNDVTKGSIRDSVEANLRSGKHYIYFLPSRTNPDFHDAATNEGAFRKWDVYAAHRDQIRFIHLPPDTLFLFREVVIYNPFPNPNSTEVTTAKGFTYFETATDTRDRLMKIPDSYLGFLKAQLHSYAENIGLQAEIERLIPELRDRLVQEDFGFLGGLIGRRSIEDSHGFKAFLDSVRSRDPNAATQLERILTRYLE
jgi:hypothetical protein